MTELTGTLSRLRDAAGVLRGLTDTQVVAELGSALELWRGDDGFAARSARALSVLKGSSAAMVRFGLGRLLDAHSPTALRQWLSEARVEAARRMAARHPRGESPDLDRLHGPPVVAQILAGNIAGLSLTAAMEALMARSAVLLKPASGDPVTAPLFKDTLDRVAPRLGRAVAVEQWEGGDEEVESRVLAAVDFVVATGGEEMVSSLRGRLVKPARIHGPRFSIGVVGMGWMNAPISWWDAVAREIVLWDQQGCLSPRLLFVAGSPRRFARRLAEAMQRWEERWPAKPWEPAEASAIHGFRAPYEMADGSSAGSLDPGGPAWTVVWDQDPTLDVGPPARAVRVTSRLKVRDLGDLLAQHAERVQGMGTAFLSPRSVGWKRIAGWSDIPWVTALTSIQDPPAGWRADGRSGLSELLSQPRERRA
jgi:hypothetical protein